MRFTTFTDYSLRVMIYVGLRQGEIVHISEASEAYAISRNHVMKVVHHLGRLGYLENIRGKNGGIRLAQRPEQIRLGDLVRATEDDLALVQCIGKDGKAACAILGACVLPDIFEQSLQAFFEVLDRYTLADLLEPSGSLSRSLFRALPADAGVAVAD